MGKSLLIGFLSALFSSSVFADTGPIVFPSANDGANKGQCISIKSPCSFDEGQTCIKKYCGIQIKQSKLDEYTKEHRLIGRKFPSLFDLETYLKKTLPPDFAGMHISFSYKKSGEKEYNPNRINVLLDSKDYISNIVIG